MKKLLITLMLYLILTQGQNEKFSIKGLELDSLNSYPIQPPALFIDIDNAIPFIWWMILPYYFYYIALLLPLMITEQSKLQAYTSIAMQLLLISYTIFIIWPITCKAVLGSVKPNPFMSLYDVIKSGSNKMHCHPYTLQ